MLKQKRIENLDDAGRSDQFDECDEPKDLIAYFVSVDKGGNIPPLKKLQIELISAIYGEAGNPKRQMDVRKVIQRQLDDWQYDFSITNKLAGKILQEVPLKFLKNISSTAKPTPSKYEKTEPCLSGIAEYFMPYIFDAAIHDKRILWWCV